MSGFISSLRLGGAAGVVGGASDTVSALRKKSFTAAEGAFAAPVLGRLVEMLPESKNKTEMTAMLEKLASGGWSKEETKHFHELFKAAQADRSEGSQAVSSHAV